MIDKLKALLPDIYKSLDKEWDSLVINRRKPHTTRLYRRFPNYRVCLHMFHPCKANETQGHPHPWPGAFLILGGSYYHSVGISKDLKSNPRYFYKELLTEGSYYEIDNKRVFHKVQPIETTWTVMINGDPWKGHIKTKTTKGKNLDKLSEQDNWAFRKLIKPMIGRQLNV